MRGFNPRQPRDRHGRWTSGVSAVPYTRHSLKSQTIGINAGTNISPNYRVSVGGHLRIERRKPTQLESKLVAGNNRLIKNITKKISPGEHLDPYIEKGVRTLQHKALSRAMGQTVNLPGSKLNVRGGTTRSGLPSVKIQYGGRKVSAKKRAAGISQYNRAMEGRRTAKAAAKVPRPQRRGKKVA